MRPIIGPLTHNKVHRDPILGRDPWFGNPGTTVLSEELSLRILKSML